jgi:hypothetical protein
MIDVIPGGYYWYYEVFWCNLKKIRPKSESWVPSFSRLLILRLYTQPEVTSDRFVCVCVEIRKLYLGRFPLSVHGPPSDLLAWSLHVGAIMHIASSLPYLVWSPNVADKLEVVTQRILDKGLWRMEILGYGLVRPMHYINQHCKPASWLAMGMCWIVTTLVSISVEGWLE